MTPQYSSLESIFGKYKDQGLSVLGFPANNFLYQEPGSNEEIKSFCTSKYGVTFDMFAKISVKGGDQCDLYKYLTDKNAGHEHGGKIAWNFTKFIVDREGKVIARFGPRTKPDAPEVIAAIEQALEKS